MADKSFTVEPNICGSPLLYHLFRYLEVLGRFRFLENFYTPCYIDTDFLLGDGTVCADAVGSFAVFFPKRRVYLAVVPDIYRSVTAAVFDLSTDSFQLQNARQTPTETTRSLKSVIPVYSVLFINNNP